MVRVPSGCLVKNDTTSMFANGMLMHFGTPRPSQTLTAARPTAATLQAAVNGITSVYGDKAGEFAARAKVLDATVNDNQSLVRLQNARTATDVAKRPQQQVRGIAQALDN